MVINVLKLESKNAKQTEMIGKKIAPYLNPPDVLLLDGDLGAGKTTFTKGLAKGLGIKRPILSPTYVIIREYKEGRVPLYHMDAYRLDDGSGEDMGLEEYFNGDGINVVEWSKYIADELPPHNLRIVFRRDDSKGDNYRTLYFEPHGKHFENVIKKALK